jgi:hypothetical protein
MWRHVVLHKVLIIPGLGGSGPDHWQTRWQDERLDCERVEQGNWDNPDPLGWICTIDAAIAKADCATIIVAHSLGCLAVGAWAALSRIDPAKPIAAMLVAPCDPYQIGANPEIARFGQVSQQRLPIYSVLVASANDPYATLSRSGCLATIWGSQLIEAGELGHINAQSNLGAWCWGQNLLDTLIAKLTKPAFNEPAYPLSAVANAHAQRLIAKPLSESI